MDPRTLARQGQHFLETYSCLLPDPALVAFCETSSSATGTSLVFVERERDKAAVRLALAAALPDVPVPVVSPWDAPGGSLASLRASISALEDLDGAGLQAALDLLLLPSPPDGGPWELAWGSPERSFLGKVYERHQEWLRTMATSWLEPHDTVLWVCAPSCADETDWEVPQEILEAVGTGLLAPHSHLVMRRWNVADPGPVSPQVHLLSPWDSPSALGLWQGDLSLGSLLPALPRGELRFCDHRKRTSRPGVGDALVRLAQRLRAGSLLPPRLDPSVAARQGFRELSTRGPVLIELLHPSRLPQTQGLLGDATWAPAPRGTPKWDGKEVASPQGDPDVKPWTSGDVDSYLQCPARFLFRSLTAGEPSGPPSWRDELASRTRSLVQGFGEYLGQLSREVPSPGDVLLAVSQSPELRENLLARLLPMGPGIPPSTLDAQRVLARLGEIWTALLEFGARAAGTWTWEPWEQVHSRISVRGQRLLHRSDVLTQVIFSTRPRPTSRGVAPEEDWGPYPHLFLAPQQEGLCGVLIVHVSGRIPFPVSRSPSPAQGPLAEEARERLQGLAAGQFPPRPAIAALCSGCRFAPGCEGKLEAMP